jgi:hypothetical protein
MKRSDSDNKNIRETRTITGKGATRGQRWHGADLKRIDGWAKNKGVTRSEAIRRLVELGLLKMKAKRKQ